MLTELTLLPVSKPRLTQRDRWMQRPAVVKYRDYCDHLRLVLPGYTLPNHLRVDFYLPMPRSWSTRKRLAYYKTAHTQKPDIDNLAKGFMDAFKEEDKHVSCLSARKFWSDEGKIIIYQEDICSVCTLKTQ